MSHSLDGTEATAQCSADPGGGQEQTESPVHVPLSEQVGHNLFWSHGACWIWDAYNRQTANFHLLLRRAVALDAPVLEGRCAVTARSLYRLYVNGVEVGRGPDPCEPDWQYFDCYDIGPYLREGDNVLAAHSYSYGVGTHFRPASPAGFLFEAHISLEGGEHVTIVSDGSWQTSEARWYAKDSPQCFWTTGFQEMCDLREKDTGWKEPPDLEQRIFEFGSSWNRAVEYGRPVRDNSCRLIAAETPRLRCRPVLPRAVMGVSRARIHASDPSLLGITARTHAPESGLIGNNYMAPNLVHFLRAERTLHSAIDLDAANRSLTDPGGSPLEIAAPARGDSVRLLVDFGTEVVGHPLVSLDAEAGGVLDIAYGEALDDHGNLDLDRGVRQVDRVVFGSGDLSWSSYDRRAFRYMLLSLRGLHGSVSLKAVTAVALEYPAEPCGSFSSSDPLLDRIWQTSVDTLKACMQQHYEDGPMRERGQYAGDLQSSALWNYHSLGDTALARKGLRMFARSQTPDGWFRTLYPSGTRHLIVDYLLNWIIALNDLYWYSGDIGLVRELLPAARRVLEWFERFTDSDGLIGGADRRDWWVFLDWYDLDRRDVVSGLNMLYAKALDSVSDLCSRIGLAAEAHRHGQTCIAVKAAINARLWNGHRQAYADCEIDGNLSDAAGSPTNILAVLYDVAPVDRWHDIHTFLTGVARRPTTPLLRIYELLVRLKCGETLDSVLGEVRAYWGEMLGRGAVTWWETFDETTPHTCLPKGSLCHAWGSGPLMLIARYLLGISPLEPGGRSIRVRPVANSLARACGSVPTPLGAVTVSHKIGGSGRDVVVTAPPACTVVPDFASSEYGTRIWVNGRLHV